MQRISLSLVFLGCLVLGACSILEPETNRQRRDLERHRSAWAALQISDYSYTTQISCFCPPESLHPVVLEVRGGKIVSARHTETGALVPPSPYDGYVQYYTVEELFRVIERDLRGSAKLEAEYDPMLHYPRYINSHIPRALDSGFIHTARDLVSLH